MATERLYPCQPELVPQRLLDIDTDLDYEVGDLTWWDEVAHKAKPASQLTSAFVTTVLGSATEANFKAVFKSRFCGICGQKFDKGDIQGRTQLSFFRLRITDIYTAQIAAAQTCYPFETAFEPGWDGSALYDQVLEAGSTSVIANVVEKITSGTRVDVTLLSGLAHYACYPSET